MNERKLAGLAISIGVAVVGMFALNGALFLHYTVRDVGKDDEIEALEQALATSASVIEGLESRIATMDVSLEAGEATVSACQAEIAAIEERAGNRGLDKRAYAAYGARIEACNLEVGSFNGALAAYRGVFDQYERELAEHNAAVEHYNTIAQSMGRTYVLLVPSGRRGKLR